MPHPAGYIYAYTTPAYRRTKWRGRRRGRGLIKVGFTRRDPHTRIREQIGASSPEKNPYTLLVSVPARTKSGRPLSDRDVHSELRRMGVRNIHNEWFEARPRDVHEALRSLGGRKWRGRQSRKSGYRLRSSRRKAAVPRSVVFLLALLFLSLVRDPAWTMDTLWGLGHAISSVAAGILATQ